MTEFGREYGEGLYALCAEENISEPVLEELKTLRGLFRDQPDFIRLLSNMTIPKEERTQVLKSVLDGQVHPYVLNFLCILVERGAVHEFDSCAAAYREYYQAAHQISRAEVTTAKPLDDSQRERLIKKLREMSGRQVELTEKTDPDILGGVLLEMDGRRYDNTIRRRLEDIRQAIKGE